MALSATTLYNELSANIDNFTTEAAAIDGWATTFDNYFQDAETLGTVLTVTPGTTTTAKTAMKTALSGLNTSGTGAGKIVDGIIAYWGGLNTNAAAIFVAIPPATGITPPTGLGTLQATLQTVFTTNITTAATKEIALTAIANAIHAVQIVGALCVFPAPPAGLGSLPIL